MKHFFLRSNIIRVCSVIIVAFVMTAKVFNFPIAIYSFERHTKDAHGNSMCDAQGKPVIEHLHAIGDFHEGHSYEYEQVKQIMDYIDSQKKPGKHSFSIIEDNKRFRYQQLYETTTWYQRRWENIKWHFRSVKKESVPQGKESIFLNELQHQFLQRDIFVENVEFNRRAASAGITDVDSQKNYPNTGSIDKAIQVFDECEKELCKLAQDNNIALTRTYSVDGLRKLIQDKKINRDTSVYDIYKQETGEADCLSAVDKSLGMALTNVSTYMNYLGYELIEHKARVYASNKYQQALDRYLPLGNKHIVKLLPQLQQDGWQLMHQSGISTSMAYQSIKSGTCLSVNVAAHFATLPKRGVSMQKQRPKFVIPVTNKIVGGLPLQLAAQKYVDITLKPIDQDKDAAARTVMLKWGN